MLGPRLRTPCAAWHAPLFLVGLGSSFEGTGTAPSVITLSRIPPRTLSSRFIYCLVGLSIPSCLHPASSSTYHLLLHAPLSTSWHAFQRQGFSWFPHRLAKKGFAFCSVSAGFQSVSRMQGAGAHMQHASRLEHPMRRITASPAPPLEPLESLNCTFPR